jgi:WD40 repeat protein
VVVAVDGIDGVPDDARVVFVSYAREDDEWRRKFVTMLKPLGDSHGVVVWSDDRVAVGAAWRPELERAIERADAALVLVSPDLLVSQFVMDEELPALVAGEIPLAFVHVRASLVEEVDELADVQWAHDRGQPLAGLPDPDAEIVLICQRLAALLPPHVPRDAGALTDSERARPPRRTPVLRGTRLGKLHGVPPPATSEVARDELAGLREVLLGEGEGTVGVTGRVRAEGLLGQGGIGKTVLAAALARDSEVRRHFPGGVYWTTVGERGDVVALQLALLERLGAARPELRSRDAAANALRQALADRRCLLVVDDVRTTAAAVSFDVTGPRGRVLYTTRDERVLVSVGANVRHVDVLPEDAARALLAELAGQRIDALPPTVNRVLATTGRVALALALVGAAVGRGGRDWDEVADELDVAHGTFRDHPYATVFKSMQVGIGAIDEQLAAAYRMLAVYPKDERVPVTAVARLWAQIDAATTSQQTRAMLQQLAEQELIVLEDDSISFHGLQHEFLLLRAGDLRLVNADLLAAYQVLAPEDWRRLPPSEPYIWEHLLTHMRGAGDGAGVYVVATDFAYLATRCARDGPYAVETDLRAAARLHPGDAAIDWALHIFIRWGHLLAGGATPGDVAATLAIRAQHPPAPLALDALRALTRGPLLTPRWGLPDAPALLRTIESHSRGVSALAFSPDGTLASTGLRTVRLWDPANGELIRTLEAHRDWVHALAFSPDGTLASASDDGTVRLWDPTNDQHTRILQGHRDSVRALAFSPDGTLASGGSDGTVCLWDPANDQHTRIPLGHCDTVRALAFSADGTLASASDDGTVRLWDPTSNQHTRTLHGHSGYGVRTVAFSPGGTLASGGVDGTVGLWDPASGRHTRILLGHRGWVLALVFSADGTLASGGSDGTVCLWDPANDQHTATLEGHRGSISALAFSSDGTLASGDGTDGTLRLWDPANSKLTRARQGHRDWVRALAFSPDGTLASASDDGTVRLWDPANDQHTRILQGHRDWVRALAFSPDGTLASAGVDQTIRLWDATNGQLTDTLPGGRGGMFALAFSPDGRMLASAGADGTVSLWDPANDQPPRRLQGHSGMLLALAFSPDGRTLAGGGDSDGTVRLWDPYSGQLTDTLRGHSKVVLAVAFSRDGRTLASASHDGTVRLWNRGQDSWRPTAWHIMRRQRHASAQLHAQGSVSAIAFSPDGRTLAGASGDSVTLWDVASCTPLCIANTGIDISALAWSADTIALAMGPAVALFDVIDGGSDR